MSALNKRQAKAETAIPATNVQVETGVPTTETVIKKVEPTLEPTAILPNLVYEPTAADEPIINAPNVIVAEQATGVIVESLFDGNLGSKLLRKGDVTNESEYVELLNTPGGRQLVRKIN